MSKERSGVIVTESHKLCKAMSIGSSTLKGSSRIDQ